MPIDPNTVQWDEPEAPDRAASPKSAAPAPAANATPATIDPASVQWDDGPSSASAAPAGAPAPPAPTLAKPSLAEQAVRGFGIGTRGVVQGLVDLPAMVSDNLIAKPLNAAADLVAGKGNGPRLKMAGESVNDLMTRAGVPEAQTASERVVESINRGAAGAASTMGAGAALTAGARAGAAAAQAPGAVGQAVGAQLLEAPALQVGSGAASGAASSVVRESGGGEGAQLAAGLVGGLAPSVGTFATKAAVRGAVRGGEAGRQQMVENIKTFEDATGTTPTLGQATQSRGIQAAETGLSNVPGGAGLMQRRGEAQAKAPQDSVQEVTDSLAPNATGWGAGEAIAKGVNAFKDNVKTTQTALYRKLDEFIPANTQVASTRTQQALADLNSDIAGAPALSAWFKNARIQGIEGGLKQDATGLEAVLSRPGVRDQVDQFRGRLEAQAARITEQNAERARLGMTNLQPSMTPEQINERVQNFIASKVDGNLPYESLKKLRTLVGNEISEGGLTADVPRSKWRALYAALSEDLGDAARAAGPQAEQAWGRANQYTRASIQRLEQLESVVNRDAPEKIFKAATSGMSDGGTQITRIMKSMPLENRREVAAAVLQRLGRARNSAQNEMGEAFSAETFLTNLAAMSGPARMALFANSGMPGLRGKIEQMGRMASIRRDGAQVFANPSGTARQAGLFGWASTLLAGLSTGNAAMIAGALAAPAIARTGAKTLTSPNVVRFMARETRLNPATAGMAVNSISQASNTEPVVYSNRVKAGVEARKQGKQVHPTPGGWVIR